MESRSVNHDPEDFPPGVDEKTQETKVICQLPDGPPLYSLHHKALRAIGRVMVRLIGIFYR